MCVVFNDTATTEIYTYGHTLSLHDACPIYGAGQPDKREGDGGAVAASSGSASHTHGNLGCVRAAAVESLPAVAGGSQGASRTDDSIGRREFPLRRQHTHA